MGPEDLLNLAFADKLVQSKDFSTWLVSRTKFAAFANQMRLLHEEQAAARTAKFWWRHWWCNVPELNAESETDILAVFEVPSSKVRFALHIENKLGTSAFLKNQAESYPFRARHMLENTKSARLKCTDFDTVIIAPHSFRHAYREKCDLFGCYISHEEIATFVPQFRTR